MQTTRQVITALTTALEALQYGDPAADVFQAVDVYDLDNVGLALRDLIRTEARIGIVVPGRERDRIDATGADWQRVHVWQSFGLMVLSRDFAPGKTSLFTDGGAYDMKEAVIGHLRGTPALGLDGCYFQPLDGQSIRLASKDVPDGREGWMLYLDVHLGSYEVRIPAGARAT